MKCPQCGARTEVYETRLREEGVLRRRKCRSSACDGRFRTLEVVALFGRKRRGRPPEILGYEVPAAQRLYLDLRELVGAAKAAEPAPAVWAEMPALLDLLGAALRSASHPVGASSAYPLGWSREASGERHECTERARSRAGEDAGAVRIEPNEDQGGEA